MDQAVELGLPDAAARRALLRVYRGALRLDASHLDHVAARTVGVTASFLKERRRRSAVIAAAKAGGDPTPAGQAEALVTGFARREFRIAEEMADRAGRAGAPLLSLMHI